MHKGDVDASRASGDTEGAEYDCVGDMNSAMTSSNTESSAAEPTLLDEGKLVREEVLTWFQELSMFADSELYPLEDLEPRV